MTTAMSDRWQTGSNSGTPVGYVRTRDACRAAGVTYRQIEYWIGRNAVQPAQRATGSGFATLFHASDVEQRLIPIGRAMADLRQLTGFVAGTSTVARWWSLLAEAGPVTDRCGAVTVELRPEPGEPDV